jgi:hypothetical protein
VVNIYGCVEISFLALMLRLSIVTETNMGSFAGYKSIFKDSFMALMESLRCSGSANISTAYNHLDPHGLHFQPNLMSSISF